MLESIVRKTKEEFDYFKDDISKMVEGYRFGRYLAEDIKLRLRILQNQPEDLLNIIALALQIAEYNFALKDVHNHESNPYSVGIVFYGIFHKEDHRLITTCLDNLTKKYSNSKEVRLLN